MEQITVHIEVDVNPTESEEKVRQAVENIFGNIHIETRSIREGALLTADTPGKEALSQFQSHLRREQIRSAARAIFSEGIDGKTITFCLNKQVAFADHVSFSKETAESPLGPIRVRIECENPRELINWLAPRAT